MIAPGIETGSDIYTLRHQIRERANEAVRIPYQSVFFRSGDAPAPHDCHANVDRWCQKIQGCVCRKSNPNILVVQPAQDRAAKNGPGQFDGARDRRILLQR